MKKLWLLHKRLEHRHFYILQALHRPSAHSVILNLDIPPGCQSVPEAPGSMGQCQGCSTHTGTSAQHAQPTHIDCVETRVSKQALQKHTYPRFTQQTKIDLVTLCSAIRDLIFLLGRHASCTKIHLCYGTSPGSPY